MCVPFAVVSWTQQFRVAVRWITTSFAYACATGKAVDFGCARCLFAGLRVVVPRCCDVTPEEAGAAFDDDTRWYTTKATSSASATTMAALQFGLRRSLILIGVAGSKTSAAVIACGPPCVWSYSRTSGSGSAPTARAILRIWPLA